MRITYIRDNLTGAVVARSVYDENMVLLISAGSVLKQKLIDNLRQRGFKYIYIQEEGTEEIKIVDAFSLENGRWVAEEVGKAFQQVKKLSGDEKVTLQAVISQLKTRKKFLDINPKGSFRQKVAKLVTDIFNRNTPTISAYSLSLLGVNPLSHAMDVTILAILLGKAFHYDISELVSLAIASLLHDLGLQLFPDVCDKPNYIFTPDDWAIYYRHPTVGYELLNALDYFSLMERQTVYQHHEFQDGTGFPLGYFGANEIPIKYQMKEKGRIFRWAEVLAVADRYVQYCAGNFTEMPLNPSQALSAILREAGKILNSSIVAELIRLINIFPIGTPVRIVDSINSEIIGYEGVVCKENSKNMERPEIILLRSKKGLKITPRKIELAKDCSAKLELAI